MANGIVRHVGRAVGLGLGLVTSAIAFPAVAQTPLSVVYPPDQHETTADRIFIIGTASPEEDVRVNGTVVERSPAGHFAPTVPLEMGANQITLQQGDTTLLLTVNRVAAVPMVTGLNFAEGSLQPAVDWVRSPGEPLCFEAIAPAGGTVSVEFNRQTLPLQPLANSVTLPPNSAVLTTQNDPLPQVAVVYRGCGIAPDPGTFGAPIYRLTLNGETLQQAASGQITIREPIPFSVAEVIVPSGTTRTGPSTDYSRLTPLPLGTQANITGQEGDWFRLDYGPWIRASDVAVRSQAFPVQSLIRSVQVRAVGDRTEVVFPLEQAVPVSLHQTADTLTLSLHNTTAQTDTILLGPDPVVQRLDWTQPQPGQVDYTLSVPGQQWGYTLSYRETNLVLSLRHPPDGSQATGDRPLAGISILLDPGHGSDADLGARGPNGYPEKDVALIVSDLLRDELEARGATVIMTREGDEDLYPQDRVDIINATEPAIALSLHYNALPDNGDALNTAGIGTFWYHAQAHDLSVFLHNYLVETLDRPSYGVFWNNLALTRPTVAPAVLLELGFMINPYEFEWIVDPDEQRQLAIALADGLTLWFQQSAP